MAAVETQPQYAPDDWLLDRIARGYFTPGYSDDALLGTGEAPVPVTLPASAVELIGRIKAGEFTPDGGVGTRGRKVGKAQITIEIIRKIAALVKHGASQQRACTDLKISESALKYHLDRKPEWRAIIKTAREEYKRTLPQKPPKTNKVYGKIGLTEIKEVAELIKINGNICESCKGFEFNEAWFRKKVNRTPEFKYIIAAAKDEYRNTRKARLNRAFGQ